MTKSKLSKRSAVFIIIAIAVVLAIIVLICSGGSGSGLTTTEKRVEYLASLGWEVDASSETAKEIVLPETLGGVLAEYNELQKQQGFDLSRFRGKQVSRCSYEVLNYPGQKEYIRANLLIYNQEVIGGDICSIYAENGFMHGFSLPEQEL